MQTVGILYSILYQISIVSCIFSPFSNLTSWKLVDSENLTKWYQPWEICMMNSKDIDEGMRDTRDKCIAKVGFPEGLIKQNHNSIILLCNIL